MQEQRFTLLQVAESIRKTIAERYSRTYWVTAEMHKLNPTRKGHCYPELVQKEDDKIVVEMRGTIWKNQFDLIQKRFASVVKEPLQDGMELLFLVKITYHPIYNLGLEILDIDPNYTLGALQRERQVTLEKLAKEGIINANQSLQMALLPKRLAVISQADSKGYSDFVTLLGGHPKGYRFDHLLFDATLQGDAAIASISNQLKRIENVKHHFDAVVIIRGGGGEIGMHCYNNYELAKTIATFPLPVLTGIGHSTNLTVCEMIAFRNGITPSDMAYFLLSIMEELDQPLSEAKNNLPHLIQHITSNQSKLLNQRSQEMVQLTQLFLKDSLLFMNEKSNQFQYSVTKKITAQKQLIQGVKSNLNYSLKNYFNQLNSHLNQETQVVHIQSIHLLKNNFNYLVETNFKLEQHAQRLLKNKGQELAQIERTVSLVHPDNVLKRGYAIVSNQNGVIKATNPLQNNDQLTVRVHGLEQEGNITGIKTKQQTNESSR